MVSRWSPPLSRPIGRAVLAFLIAGGLVWWHASSDQLFYVVGLSEPWATTLGPLLTALSAGLTIALAFSLVDAAAGMTAAVVAALMVFALPGFLELHHDSLTGPPLTAITLMMLALMLHAPRWSIAYGALAAIAAVHVAPSAAGLPIAAIGWAAVVRGREGNGIGPRIALATLPLGLSMIAALRLGHAWLDAGVPGWRGGFDRGLQSAGSVLGDQLAPSLQTPALRWFAVADLTLICVAVMVTAWRRPAGDATPDAVTRRFLGAAWVLAVAIALGLAGLWLLMPATPPPRLETVFPLAVVGALALVVSTAVLWSRWPRWGKAAAVLIALGWFQAAIRG